MFCITFFVTWMAEWNFPLVAVLLVNQNALKWLAAKTSRPGMRFALSKRQVVLKNMEKSVLSFTVINDRLERVNNFVHLQSRITSGVVDVNPTSIPPCTIRTYSNWMKGMSRRTTNDMTVPGYIHNVRDKTFEFDLGIRSPSEYSALPPIHRTVSLFSLDWSLTPSTQPKIFTHYQIKRQADLAWKKGI